MCVFFLSAQSCLPEMICIRDLRLEKSASCRRPGGGGSTGSLIPTLRAPADVRAPEPTGSAWPERLPSSSRKSCLCVCPEPWGGGGRQAAPALGWSLQGRPGLRPPRLLPKLLTKCSGALCSDPTPWAGDANPRRRNMMKAGGNAWKEKQKGRGLLGWHRHFSPVEISPSLSLFSAS